MDRAGVPQKLPSRQSEHRDHHDERGPIEKTLSESQNVNFSAEPKVFRTVVGHEGHRP